MFSGETNPKTVFFSSISTKFFSVKQTTSEHILVSLSSGDLICHKIEPKESKNEQNGLDVEITQIGKWNYLRSNQEENKVQEVLYPSLEKETYQEKPSKQEIQSVWISNIEIETYSLLDTPLWLNDQFKFKKYTDMIEDLTQSVHIRKSDPVPVTISNKEKGTPLKDSITQAMETPFSKKDPKNEIQSRRLSDTSKEKEIIFETKKEVKEVPPVVIVQPKKGKDLKEEPTIRELMNELSSSLNGGFFENPESEYDKYKPESHQDESKPLLNFGMTQENINEMKQENHFEKEEKKEEKREEKSIQQIQPIIEEKKEEITLEKQDEVVKEESEDNEDKHDLKEKRDLSMSDQFLNQPANNQNNLKKSSLSQSIHNDYFKSPDEGDGSDMTQKKNQILDDFFK